MSDDFTADMTVPIILLMTPGGWLLLMTLGALREESSQTNVILQYKLLASILSAFCCVIQQS